MKKNRGIVLSGIYFLIFLILFPISVSAQETQAEPHQVIVQYQQDYAPFQLEADIHSLESQNKGLLTQVSLFVSEFIDTLVHKPSPQEYLRDIMKTEERAGILEKTRMFDAGNESQSNTYLYTLNQSHSVDEAISIFEDSPYVKYAQPNYLYVTESNL